MLIVGCRSLALVISAEANVACSGRKIVAKNSEYAASVEGFYEIRGGAGRYVGFWPQASGRMRWCGREAQRVDRRRQAYVGDESG